MWVSSVKATIKSRTKEARPVSCNVTIAFCLCLSVSSLLCLVFVNLFEIPKSDNKYVDNNCESIE